MIRVSESSLSHTKLAGARIRGGGGDPRHAARKSVGGFSFASILEVPPETAISRCGNVKSVKYVAVRRVRQSVRDFVPYALSGVRDDTHSLFG